MKKGQNTKKVIVWLMLLVLTLFAMTGCKGEDEPETTAEPSTEDLSYLEAYAEYVQSIMDSNYHGNYTAYMQITGATKEQAQAMTKAHAVNLAEQMADFYDIRLSMIPQEIGDRLTQIAYSVYKAAIYTVGEPEKVGEKIYVTISVEPLKFYEGASVQIDEYVAEFNARAKKGEFENMTESEYENEYAKGILEVLEESVKEIAGANAKTYRIQIRYNEQTGVSYIAEEDLDAVNLMILEEWEG